MFHFLKLLPSRANKMTKIDIKGGQLTFEQRIDIGKLFQSNVSEFEMFKETFIILHNKEVKKREYSFYVNYFKEVIDGISFWVEQETNLLKYEPTAEEKQAGIEKFTKEVGEFGTIKSMAKAYGCDPDVILGWKYGKVFGILFTDLKEYKFKENYHKIMQSKYK